MVAKIKSLKMELLASARTGEVEDGVVGRNFFDDLKEATVELKSSPKDAPVSTRLVTERISRNLQLGARS